MQPVQLANVVADRVQALRRLAEANKIELTSTSNGSMPMRGNAELQAVNLEYAHVGGQLSLRGSKVAGELDMTRLQVEQSLFMGGNAEFQQVVLRSAHVGGQLVLNGSKVGGELDMNGLKVDQDLFMGDASSRRLSLLAPVSAANLT
jgi:hypothetical protein